MLLVKVQNIINKYLIAIKHRCMLLHKREYNDRHLNGFVSVQSDRDYRALQRRLSHFKSQKKVEQYYNWIIRLPILCKWVIQWNVQSTI